MVNNERKQSLGSDGNSGDVLYHSIMKDLLSVIKLNGKVQICDLARL